MTWLDNISIRIKLVGTFVIIGIILVMVAVAGYTSLSGLSDGSSKIYEEGLLPIVQLKVVDTEIQELRVDLLRYIDFPEERPALKQSIEQRVADINRDLTFYRVNYMDSDEVGDVTLLEEYFADYSRELAKIQQEITTGNATYAHASVSQSGRAVEIKSRMNDLLQKMVAGESQSAASLNEVNHQAAGVAGGFIIVTTIIGLIVALGLAYLITKGIIGPLWEAVTVAERIGQGESSARVTFSRDDELGILGSALNQMGGRVNAMIQDVQNLAGAARRGDLAVRADPSTHEGDYRKIVADVNETLDAVIGPLNVAAEYVDRIAHGDLPEKITDEYKGDFNEIKININNLIEILKNRGQDVNYLIESVIAGNLAIRADTTKYMGVHKNAIDGVNRLLDAVIGPLNVAAEYVDRISRGDIPEEITEEYQGDFNEIKNNLNQCIAAVNLLIEDANQLTKAAIAGKLTTRADPSRHQGDFRRIVDGVNSTLDAVIGPLNVAAEYVDRIAHGEIPQKITDEYQGDFNAIKDNLNQCIAAVNLLIEDANLLTRAAVAGKLVTRADPSRHQSDFRRIVDGVNSTLDAVIGPVYEAMRVSGEFASGNFSARVDEKVQVEGDFIALRDALNSTGVELSRMMTLINKELYEGISVLSTASSEILTITQQLGAATSETATSVTETSATVEEVRKTTEVSHEKAKAIVEKAQRAGQVTQTGQKAVEAILLGMENIQRQMEAIAMTVVKLSEQSQAIGEIIATVGDIAEQSNLLAVNASIEAAKAGDLGRGFTVVAHEIRTLAGQSKQATAHIRTILTEIQRGISSTVLSTEQGGKTVATGVTLTADARGAIDLLAQSVTDASRASVQIAATSKEQVVGMDQIALAMENIRAAAQNTLEITRHVEKTAQDLHDLGLRLKEITGHYRV
ncbi:MAG: methyl-accepting chemotaxis protein [Methanomicrobiales archaeon]|nr:methyl-accepting chemotaxis protein [Methanomicrobiales archaeon]